MWLQQQHEMLTRPLKTDPGSEALRNGTELPSNKSLFPLGVALGSLPSSKDSFSSLKFLLPCQQPASGCPLPNSLKEIGPHFDPRSVQMASTVSGLILPSSGMRLHERALLSTSDWGKDPNVLSCKEKEESGAWGVKINNKAFDKNSRRNDSESLFWFVQLFF